MSQSTSAAPPSTPGTTLRNAACATLTSTNVVAFLADVFARRGTDEYLGEPVSMAEHMLQAARCAEKAGQPAGVVAAALLHDIGHFTSEFGTYAPTDTVDKHHEDAGADLLAPFFPPLVTDCVRHHVAAKRYLCATRPEYLNKLSPASVHTLSLQGGPMDAASVAAFEINPHHQAIVKVRIYDDTGKRAGTPTKSFDDYTPMLQKLVDAHCGRSATSV